MSYCLDRFRLGKFYAYIQRVFCFQHHVAQLNDFREAPDIPTGSLFETLFLGFVFHLPSLKALAFEMSQGNVRKVLRHRCDFCINSLRYGTHQFELETLEQMLVSLGQTMKRSKMLRDTIDGLHVAALDGTEFFRSEAIHCPECLLFQVTKKAKDDDGNEIEVTVTQYTHRSVALQHVGGQLKPFLAAEPIRRQEGDKEPGHEGELTAAKRLLTRANLLYGKRFIDLLTLDALYMNEPFVRHCLSLGMHLLARVKREDTYLYQEIDQLAEHVKPVEGVDPHTGVRYAIYTVPGVRIKDNTPLWLDGYKIVETKPRGEAHTFYCATTATRDTFPIKPDTIRRIVHHKWGIENNGFKDLKDNWHLEHNFHHHPVGTWAILLILLIAYNLFYAYVYRQMKTYRIYQLSIR